MVVLVEDTDELGMGIDFRTLREVLDRVVQNFDHRHLNDLDPFLDVNPTAESIARYLFHEVRSELSEGVKVQEVRVEETDRYWAAYLE
jgi:6-pyruvoyltetrahydropterin/6-carboxytetrahydropterin synthase